MKFAVFFALAVCIFAAGAPALAMQVTDLRCEYHTNPLGIDSPSPHLQWIVQSARRGDRQTAYRILVASSAAKLRRDKGDLWDSRTLHSDQTAQIAYGGRRLVSGEYCYWKVRAWDMNGKPSSWSSPALWSMGLLNASDWKAGWIGYDAAYSTPARAYRDANSLYLTGLSWVRLPDGVASTNNTAFLRKTFTLPEDQKVRSAVFVLYGDNECEADINGKDIGQAYRWQPTALLDATTAIHSGENVVSVTVQNTDFLAPQAIGRLVVMFDSGPNLVIPMDSTWKISGQSTHGWEEQGFNDTAWSAPALGGSPWGTPSPADILRTPVPYLRRTFTLAKPIKRAIVYVTALGVYDLYLNGRRVGQDYLNPGWTDFRKRVTYKAYDVTGIVRQGANAIGALLGDGWYASDLDFTGVRNWYGGKPRLLAQLVIENTDNTTNTVVTDGKWKARFGPIEQADLQLGDVIDERRELAGWDMPGYHDASWSPVAAGAGEPRSAMAGLIVQSDPVEPARIMDLLPAIKMTEPKAGLYVFDLGQNMVGWTRLRVAGAPGQEITVRQGEMLNLDGTVYTANLRAASGTDIYYLRGYGAETLEPPFTQKGFRYVEVRGLASKPSLGAVTGVVVYSDMPRTGYFACSNPLLNRLYRNIVWGQRGNYVVLPSGCPQRDERSGWTGDAAVFMPSAAYNYDVASFFTGWLTTLCEDSQYPDGSFANVAPDIGVGGGATGWGDAALQCTYQIYKVYGDKRIIADHYAAMSRYMGFLASHSTGFVPQNGGFGDWLNLGGGASLPVINTAYYAYLAQIMAEMAQAIGKNSDARYYAHLHDDVRSAFIQNFVLPDGSIKDSSQTGYALAFTMGLVPADRRALAAAQYVNQIRRFQWHLATGFLGTPRLLPGLHEINRDDIAYRVLMQETYPGWLNWVKLGATTLWERWDSWTPKQGFQTIGMNSFNHVAFGSVGQFLYSTVGGIDTDGVGYKRILIQPEPGGGLTWARVRFNSINGPIVSSWKLNAGVFTLNIMIPTNTRATVYVPTSNGVVTEGGAPAAKALDVKFLRRENGAAVYAVGSGIYSFQSVTSTRSWEGND